jgi:hypothetical protein
MPATSGPPSLEGAVLLQERDKEGFNGSLFLGRLASGRCMLFVLLLVWLAMVQLLVGLLVGMNECLLTLAALYLY